MKAKGRAIAPPKATGPGVCKSAMRGETGETGKRARPPGFSIDQPGASRNHVCTMKSLTFVILGFAILAGQAADSLVQNGGFEQVNATNSVRPAHWDQPDGLGVQWTNAPEASHGKAIRMNTAITEKQLNEQCKKAGVEQWIIPNPTGGAVGENYGLSLYSEAIPVTRGQPYKITFDYKGPSGGAKMWVRGYGEYQGERRRLWETTVECRVANAREWTTIAQEFFPTKERPGLKRLQNITEMKVMLYSFYPTAVYWFDNVKIEPITLQEFEQLQKTAAPAAHGRKPSGGAKP